MPDIIDKLDWLSSVAEQAKVTPSLEREKFFARLNNKATEDFFPIRLFTGMGALSAAAAGVVLIFATGAWMDLSDPLVYGIQSLLEIMP